MSALIHCLIQLLKTLFNSMFSAHGVAQSPEHRGVTSTVFGTGDSAITYILKPDVSTASIKHAAATLKATTDVAVVGSAVAVTPGTKARMIVTGTGTLAHDGVPVSFFELHKNGFHDERTSWRNTWTDEPYTPDQAAVWISDESRWGLYSSISSFPYFAEWSGPEDVASPDLVLVWIPQGLATGTPTVTAAVSSANQVLSALDASVAAEALITFALAPGSDGTAAVAAQALVTLHT